MRTSRKRQDISTPLRAIRAFCLECVGYDRNEVKLCTAGPRLAEDEPGCPLFEYRFGHNPKRKGIGGNPRLKKGQNRQLELGKAA